MIDHFSDANKQYRNSVFKVLYLRITEFYRKWDERPVANWALVRNQLLLDERLNALFAKFDR